MPDKSNIEHLRRSFPWQVTDIYSRGQLRKAQKASSDSGERCSTFITGARSSWNTLDVNVSGHDKREGNSVCYSMLQGQKITAVGQFCQLASVIVHQCTMERCCTRCIAKQKEVSKRLGLFAARIVFMAISIKNIVAIAIKYVSVEKNEDVLRGRKSGT